MSLHDAFFDVTARLKTGAIIMSLKGGGLAGVFMMSACAAPYTLPPQIPAPPSSLPQTLNLKPGSTIYLVRHAEKQAGEDPELTPEGRARALALSDIIPTDRPLDRLYSTATRRTLQTAAPLAAKSGVTTLTYEGSDLEGIAQVLRQDCGLCVVVGHSNTTPTLAALLGGDEGAPITEATEYDRLYILTQSGGKTATQIVRFGAPSPAALSAEN